MEKNNNYHGYIYSPWTYPNQYTWLDWKNSREENRLIEYTIDRSCSVNMDGKIINASNLSFTSMADYFEPKQVIFQDQKSTTVVWADGSKTTVNLMENDEFNEEAGFAMALVKRIYGCRSSFLRMLKEKGHHRLSSKNKKLQRQQFVNDFMDVNIKFKPTKGSDSVE